MKKDILIFSVIAFAILSIPLAYGFIQHGSNYFSVTDNINYRMSGVIAGGGNMFLSGTGYNMSAVISQPVIGKVSGGPYNMSLGFFFGEISERWTSITINGNLKYANGTAVSNSEVRATVSYLSESYYATNRTDSTGYFNLTIPVPDYFMKYKFTMEIYVIGDIEAVYRCYYCPATNKCSPTQC